MKAKKKTEFWSNIYYPELTKGENILISNARYKGYCDFFPCYPSALAQSINTLNGAIDYLKNLQS
jgi:hypothetical protein